MKSIADHGDAPADRPRKGRAERGGRRLPTDTLLLLVRRFPIRLVAIVWWRLTGRRQRARHRLRDMLALVLDPYDHWLGWVEPETGSDEVLRRFVDDRPQWPKIAVIALGGKDDAEWLVRVLAILQEQPYSNWELVVDQKLADADNVPSIDAIARRLRRVGSVGDSVGDRADFLRCALEATSADLVYPIDPGMVPARCALSVIATRAQGCALVFGDEDRLDPDGQRCDPWFKPEWNEDLALAQDFLSGACAFDRTRAVAIASRQGISARHAVYELALRLARAHPDAIARLAHVISHRLAPRDDRGRLDSVTRLIEPQGARAQVAATRRIAVDWPLPDRMPLVSLVVPTRDQAGLLAACLGSVLERTAYPTYEILVMDNGSIEPETQACFADLSRNPRVRVVAHDGPFNYSAINNRAAGPAGGRRTSPAR